MIQHTISSKTGSRIEHIQNKTEKEKTTQRKGETTQKEQQQKKPIKEKINKNKKYKDPRHTRNNENNRTKEKRDRQWERQRNEKAKAYIGKNPVYKTKLAKLIKKYHKTHNTELEWTTIKTKKDKQGKIISIIKNKTKIEDIVKNKMWPKPRKAGLLNKTLLPIIDKEPKQDKKAEYIEMNEEEEEEEIQKKFMEKIPK